MSTREMHPSRQEDRSRGLWRGARRHEYYGGEDAFGKALRARAPGDYHDPDMTRDGVNVKIHESYIKK